MLAMKKKLRRQISKNKARGRNPYFHRAQTGPWAHQALSSVDGSSSSLKDKEAAASRWLLCTRSRLFGVCVELPWCW